MISSSRHTVRQTIKADGFQGLALWRARRDPDSVPPAAADPTPPTESATDATPKAE